MFARIRRGLAAFGVTALLAALTSIAPIHAALAVQTQTTERVSVATADTQIEQGVSTQLDADETVSEDGRYVAFVSDAPNLLPNPSAANPQVYLRDRVAHVTKLVSASYQGGPSNGGNFQPTVSPNGRFVAWRSNASNLIDPNTGFVDNNGSGDVYLYDRGTGLTKIVSLSSTGVLGNDTSERPSISANGQYVSFDSFATNLDPSGPDTNGNSDVYLRDVVNNTTRRVSVAANGTVGNGYNSFSSISDDGMIVAWASGSSNLLGRPFGTIVRDMSVASGWTLDVLPGNGAQPSISADGRYIAYPSDTNLVPADTNGNDDIYRYDRQDGSLDLVSIGASGEAVGGSPAISISDDGGAVTFASGSPDVLPAGGDTNGTTDIFVWRDGVVERASVATNGAETNAASTEAGLSGDGQVVAFTSYATNLIGAGNDTNGYQDVFVRVSVTVPTHQLTAARTGSGQGTITSDPAGIDCGATCDANYDDGTTVTLTATPNLTSTFDGWSEDCSGTGTCTVTMDQARSVTATFSKVTHRLNVTRAGTGSGTVTSAPSGIDCGATCSFDFDAGQQVTLAAMPQLGSTFEGWSGACSGVDDCNVTMDQVRNVTATFDAFPTVYPRFTDDFNGAALDAARWNTTLATTGVRWCPSTQANHLSVPGQWQDVGTTPCHSVLQSPPHGSISVTGGVATLSAGARRTFPYIWRGRPSKTSPFPSTGAFVLDVRMRFPALGASGSELNVGDWPNTDPVGDNPPGSSIFSVGACTSCGLVTNLLGTTDTISNPTAFHDYRLEYVRGRYSLWVDNVRTIGPIASSRRPDSIWAGNPVMTFFAFNDWADLALDSVRVSGERYPLTVSTDGTGGGTVSSDPVGIDCGSTCQAGFDVDASVTLTAIGDGASAFSGWSGGGCSGTGTCVVTMDQAQTVTATFGVATRPLSVSRNGTGGGSVTSDPAGIDCGATCSSGFPYGTHVTLTASASQLSNFSGWSGEGCSGTGTCIVTMDQARTVTATFTKKAYVLSVTRSGTGSGSVSSDPSGITCGGTCTATFDAGVLVTLTPAADTGSVFQGWGGDCAGTGACTVTMTKVTSVVATFAPLPTNPLWTWGNNEYGQLGYATTCQFSCPIPTRVPQLSDVIAVSSRGAQTLALRSDGTVWGFGSNGSGELGSIACTQACPPAQVPGLTQVTAVAAGGGFSLALRSDGTVWSWGNNSIGQLGRSCVSPCSTPGQVVGLTGVVSISTGQWHALALRSDGTVWAWGWNGVGLGTSCTTSSCGTPAQVLGLSSVTAVSAGEDHSIALRAGGTVWAWGNNQVGQLGNTSCSLTCSTPTQVGGLSNVVAISTSVDHSLAVRSDGTVWAWGRNASDQLGYNSSVCSGPCPTPTQVSGLSGVVAVSAGSNHSLALRSDGTVWGWGGDGDGQLGPGWSGFGNTATPKEIAGLVHVDAIEAAGNDSMVVANGFVPLGETVTATSSAGDPVTTDTENDGATPDDPVETAITTPQGGNVIVEDGPSNVTTPAGYGLIGHQIEITAPPASATEPLVLVLRVDASLIPTGQSADTIAVFRNGSYVLGCTGPSGNAEPDPCVSDRRTLVDGDAQITVLTSHASTWNLGFPAPIARAGGPYTVTEGSTVRLDATASTGASPLRYDWFPSFSLDDPTLARPTLSGIDDGSQQMTLQVADASGISSTAVTSVTVTNANPVVHVSGPTSVVSGQTVALSSSFTDAGTVDTHTATVNWGDGVTTNGTVVDANGSGIVSGNHRYLVPGTYAITVKVNDDDHGVGQATSSTFTVARAPVGVDVKPGDAANTIQLSSKQVQVAVLSTSTFNATTQLVRSSLTFGRTGAEASLVIAKGVPSCTTPDVNGDGRKDLQCVFTTNLLALRTTDTQAALRALTTDGVYWEGRNTVKVTK